MLIRLDPQVEHPLPMGRHADRPGHRLLGPRRLRRVAQTSLRSETSRSLRPQRRQQQRWPTHEAWLGQ